MCHTYLMGTGPVCRQAGPVPALFNYEATLFWHVQNVSRHRLAEISRTSLEKTLLDGSTCRSNTCIHLPALMVPSQMCKLPMMPRALARPWTITDTGSELCADRDLDGPSPLCPAGHDIQDFKEQSEMWTQNVCKYLQKKKHQISFSFLSLWCFQLNISWKWFSVHCILFLFTFTQVPTSLDFCFFSFSSLHTDENNIMNIILYTLDL